MIKITLLTLVALFLIFLAAAWLHAFFMTPAPTEKMLKSPQWRDGKFVNPIPVPMFKGGWSAVWPNIKGTVGMGKDRKPETTLPSHPIDNTIWSDSTPETFAFVWLGHSSLLVRAEGVTILVDPVLDERASPISFFGPKRFHPTPVTVDTLPPVDVVLITHDHFDHLEKSTILALADRVDHFFAPIGIDALLAQWGVPASKITPFEWWDEEKVGPLKFIATPALHYARRGLFDGDRRLWTSWAVKGETSSFFVSGDSGYFDVYKKVGETFGPFDAAFLKVGSYGPGWTQIHMSPEEAFLQFKDLKAKTLVPTHFATFDLGYHPWYEPAERILAATESSDAFLLTPEVGIEVDLVDPPKTDRWWRRFIDNKM